jgi:hypothetical protein
MIFADKETGSQSNNIKGIWCYVKSMIDTCDKKIILKYLIPTFQIHI